MPKRRTLNSTRLLRADTSLLVVIAVMVFFGLVMIYDATVFYAHTSFGTAYKFVLLHVVWLLIGLGGFFFFYNYNYKNFAKLSYTLFLISLVFLGILSVFGFLKVVGVLKCNTNTLFVPCVNGAYRWFYVNPPPLPSIPFLGVLGFQPGELAKFSFILYLAVQISKAMRDPGRNAFTIYIVTALFVSGLIILQPNMSTAALIFLIGSVMYLASGSSLVPLFITAPIMTLIGGIAVLVSPYRKARLLTLLGFGDGTELSIGYHMQQILIALGSGGLFGVGFGQSRQKYQYLPEVAADSIFAIIGEELGFLGTVAVVLLFCFFVYKGFEVAKNAPDLLGRLLASGITAWIGLQFFINVAAMTKLIPLTGMPIPLISYGGSATVFALMGLGILVNISKYSHLK